jgi:signal peptidase I
MKKTPRQKHASERAAESAPQGRKSVFREYAEALAVAVILALLIRTFVVQAFNIPSGSMIPSLLIGDHVLVAKFWNRFFDPQRGDIIVFTSPQDGKTDLIKRVMALPGESIAIKRKQVFINGDPLVESYTMASKNSFEPAYASHRDNFGPVTIPANKYFVLGDNRDNSYDSRYWGFVKRDNIRGKAFIVYWSWNGAADWLHVVRWDRFAKILR